MSQKVSSIVTKILGGNGGGAFPQNYVTSFGLRGGEYIDALTLNGTQHGGNGGAPTDILTLDNQNDEYISHVSGRCGQFIDQLSFWTSKERSIGTGGSGGGAFDLQNIRVIAMGGQSGQYLDQLVLTYVDNYQPSTVEVEHAKFILSYTPQGTTIETYESSKAIASNSYENITSHMLSQTYDASVEAEYGAKVAASTSIQFVDSSLTTIKQSLETVLEQSKKTTSIVGTGQVGVLMVEGTIMKGADGKYWMYASGDCTNFTVVNMSDWRNFLDCYDLTGTLDTQLGELIPHRTSQYGYIYYKA